MGYSFPHPNTASQEGLVAVGGDLSIDTLFNAYSNGIFPWPFEEETPMLWFSLNPRGILPCSSLHISKSMRRVINANKYKVVFNNNFEAVIDQCAHVKRKDQTSTWIDEKIKKAYINLFNHKKAYCVEVYNNEYKLVGGLYGVCFGDIISAESMFHLESNTSKLAIIKLIQKLKLKNIQFIDTQMVTSVVQSLGAIEIQRNDFLDLISSLNTNRSRDELFC